MHEWTSNTIKKGPLHWIVFLFLFIAVLLFEGIDGSATDYSRLSDILPFEHRQIVTPHGLNFGFFTVQIMAWRNPGAILDSYCLEITNLDKVKYNGPLHFVAPIGANDTTIFEFEVYVPPDDTAGLTCYLHGVNVSSGIDIHLIQPYWITTGDTAVIFEVDPRSLPKEYFRPTYSIMPQGMIADTVKRTWESLKPSICDGYHDTFGNPISKARWLDLISKLFGWPTGYFPSDFGKYCWLDTIGNVLPEHEWEIQRRLYQQRVSSYDITKDTTVIWIMDSVTGKIKPVWKLWHEKKNTRK